LTKEPPIFFNDTEKNNYTSNTIKNSSGLCGEFRYKLFSIRSKDLESAKSIGELCFQTQRHRKRVEIIFKILILKCQRIILNILKELLTELFNFKFQNRSL